MKKYLKFKNVYSFLRKYGILMGPYSLIKWVLLKYKYKKYASMISKVNIDIFNIINHSKFSDVYSGDLNNETFRIINGERKVLFYKYEDKNMQCDIKSRWELNRMHHLPIIALNSKLKNRCIHEFKYENLSKIFHNTNAMEVSIAAINVLTSYQLCNQNYKSMIEEDIRLFLRNCMNYIMNNIEVGLKYSKNHYFFNLLGLLWITENISGSKHINLIREFAYNKLEQLLNQIINKDGSLYEGSTHYHKYVTDSLLSFLFFNTHSQKRGKIISYAKSMYYFCCYSSFDKKLIGFGDNDSGRVLPLPMYFNYHSYDLLVTEMLAKKLGFIKYNSKIENKIRLLNLSETPSFGLQKLKSINWHVAIRCDQIRNRSVNKLVGSHYHNDQLSILANYKSEHLLVDAGTYSYIQDNEMRLQNLKTSSHNTVSLPGEEQNIIFNDFKYTERRAKAKIIYIDESEIITQHIGYMDLGVLHKRKVDLLNETLKVTDLLIKNTIREQKAIITYNIHPNFEVKQLNSNKILLTNRSDIQIKVIITGDCFVEILKSSFSEEYGFKIENNVIKIELLLGEQEDQKEITTQFI